jgi:hydroxyethylthiazole kinase-like uncharacterized protein yjeF
MSTHLPPAAVLPSQQGWPLHNTAASRRLEALGQATRPPHALMALAGLMVARLAQALAAPDAAIWVAAGPGNNGGDGLVAARHLRQWGRQVSVCWLGRPEALPDDARDALAQAQAAGVSISSALPGPWPGAPSGATAPLFTIDALLGLGASRAPQGTVAAAIAWLRSTAAPCLAVDLPSGLAADTGQVLGDAAVRATHTLSLLTLKPGLFTADGRDHAGRVWLHRLGLPGDAEPASAWLSAPPQPALRGHSQHKGSFGDVIVLGGAPGMGGAALLAARAALAAGAGRVLLARLDAHPLGIDVLRPELMPREPAQVLRPELLAAATVVCGCGGGAAVAALLPAVLAHAGRLVLDADGLNAVAASPALAALLQARAGRGQPTVLTPHPLEAARLLAITRDQVQADRLQHASALALALQATVVLKGSGSVVATPGQAPAINPTGNARLATAGSGDVLVGWLGGSWSAAARTATAHEVACAAVWLHGAASEQGDPRLPLRAGDLIDALAGALPGSTPTPQR